MKDQKLCQISNVNHYSTPQKISRDLYKAQNLGKVHQRTGEMLVYF